MSAGAGIEVVEAHDDRGAAFRRTHEREALSTLWDFRVVPHEQHHEFLALDPGGSVVGALAVRIAASLAHVESLIVLADRRRGGIGRRLLARCEDVANYYNCHKVTVEVPAGGTARAFLEACGYKAEAILPQHTFKKDVAVMRKFLL